MFTVYALCLTASFVGGVIDSIAGGGGLITMPAMLLAGLPPHVTLGTGKFASTIGTVPALLNYARSGFVVWRMVPAGVACALAGSWAGSSLALLLDSSTLGNILICLLPIGLLATLCPKKSGEGVPRPQQGWLFWGVMCTVAFAVGMYDGFFGPGTGSFFIIAFHFILRMGLVEASGTAKVFNLASNAGAMITFCIGGKVWYALAVPMACASMTGNWVGSRLAICMGPGIVRKFLGVSLAILMLTLIVRAVQQ